MDMGRREKKVRCMKRVTWKLKLPYAKEIANWNLLYGSGNSNRGSVSTQRGGMEREMGGRFKSEGIYGSPALPSESVLEPDLEATVPLCPCGN